MMMMMMMTWFLSLLLRHLDRFGHFAALTGVTNTRQIWTQPDPTQYNVTMEVTV